MVQEYNIKRDREMMGKFKQAVFDAAEVIVHHDRPKKEAPEQEVEQPEEGTPAPQPEVGQEPGVTQAAKMARVTTIFDKYL